MSVDKDPAFFSILVGIIMALIGVLNFIGAAILRKMWGSIETLFSRANATDNKVSRLEGICEIRHKHDK